MTSPANTTGPRPASWVICDRATGAAVLETYSPRLVACINTAKYRAVPVLEYLQALNRQIAADRHGAA